MNCFEFRRLILASPREKTREQEEHMVQCASCANLTRELENFESRIQEAALVPVPEALAERVLLRHQIRRPDRYRVWALAASLVAALGVGIYFYPSPVGEERIHAATSLGTNHPAVKAIVHVLDDEPRMMQENRGVDPVAMRAAFTRLGLNVPASGTTVLYFDKCPMTGGAGEHVVLQTPFGQVTLILIPDQPFASRVVVADRHKTAVAGPAHASGYYILVADSLIKAKQVEKMLL
jgi:hypothetical protein